MNTTTDRTTLRILDSTISSRQADPSEEPWTDKQNWRRLQKGMTKDAVTRILGEPERINRGIAYEFWYYPRGGDITFDDNGRLMSWSEP